MQPALTTDMVSAAREGGCVPCFCEHTCAHMFACEGRQQWSSAYPVSGMLLVAVVAAAGSAGLTMSNTCSHAKPS